jgi:broad specificity polyphosphatase/5'/3'-nucleotidase SurE
VVREDPCGRPYDWIGGSEPEDLYQDGTDVTTVAAGYASLTAVHKDLTSSAGTALIEGRRLGTL